MTDYEKLKKIIEDAEGLIKKGVTSSDPEFEAWEMRVKRFISSKYGEHSMEMKKFDDTPFFMGVWSLDTPDDVYHRDCVNSCRSGLNTTIAILKTYLEDLQEKEETVQQPKAESHKDLSKIFIVHGHDGELKQSVARIIDSQSIKPIILSEQANRGRTIIEKFEENSDVGCAICLFTADDIGRAKSEEDDKTRARQNVVFEAGYFMGKLGRDHIVIIAESGIEMPSDLGGVVYTDKTSWQIELLKELKAMGYKVSADKLLD